MVLKNRAKLILPVALLVFSGCAGLLPDARKIENNMDQMTAYMGMMVGVTAKMAAAAERMEQKSDALIAGLEKNLDKKGSSAERAIQNITQAFLDNEKAMIKTLQGIKAEIAEFRQAVQQSSATPGKQSSSDAAIMLRKSVELERKLGSLAGQIDRIHGGKQ
jgi:hypothetical protein